MASEFTPFVAQIYECTLQKLKSQEVDQEVKERAIICMGQIISNLGDVLNAELAICLPIFLERLRNEVTRLSAVKALIMIAGSPLRVNLTPILVSRLEIINFILQFNSVFTNFIRLQQYFQTFFSLQLFNCWVHSYERINVH